MSLRAGEWIFVDLAMQRWSKANTIRERIFWKLATRLSNMKDTNHFNQIAAGVFQIPFSSFPLDGVGSRACIFVGSSCHSVVP